MDGSGADRCLRPRELAQGLRDVQHHRRRGCRRRSHRNARSLGGDRPRCAYRAGSGGREALPPPLPRTRIARVDAACRAQSGRCSGSARSWLYACRSRARDVAGGDSFHRETMRRHGARMLHPRCIVLLGFRSVPLFGHGEKP